MLPHGSTQVTQFPKTNVIDLGAWIIVKYGVEKYHRRNLKQHDSLTWSVKNTWRNVEKPKLKRIYNRLLKVISLVIQNQGGNKLVGSNWVLKGAPENDV